MKVVAIISVIMNVLLTILIVSMFNTKITWVFYGHDYTYKLGDFYLEKIGIRGE